MDATEEGFEVVEGIEEDFEDESDESARDSLLTLIENLQKTAIDGMETFQDCSDASRSRIHAVFCLLDHHLQHLDLCITNLFELAKNYDFNGLRANGYRSCLKILRCCCERILQISEEISEGKDHLFLSLRSGYRDLESFVACIGQMRSCVLHLEQLPETAKEGCLFSRTDETLFTLEADKMFSELEALNREPFYGRCLGNQFCKSMQNPLKMINVAMASFGESFNKDTIMNKWALSFISSGKYFMNPELRAQQVVKTTQNSSIDFCKAFWNIAETDLLQELPMIVCPPVQVSHGFEVCPEPLRLPRMDGGGLVDVPLPESFHGCRPIGVRLISHVFREGQEQLVGREAVGKVEMQPASPCLIIHCHGGGFVAQSAKSHEMYLRHWARGVGVPILSIDYSLAPESPYPRALQEIYYTYCWAMDNSDLLGSTGERICFAGDSSGANLMLCTCIKAIQEGVRLPDGVLSIYAATYVSYAPSPSRLLAVMDPLLPVGVLSRCLAAYAGFDSRDVLHHYVSRRRSMNDGWMDPAIQDRLNRLPAQGAESIRPAPPLSHASPCPDTSQPSQLAAPSDTTGDSKPPPPDTPPQPIHVSTASPSNQEESASPSNEEESASPSNTEESASPNNTEESASPNNKEESALTSDVNPRSEKGCPLPGYDEESPSDSYHSPPNFSPEKAENGTVKFEIGASQNDSDDDFISLDLDSSDTMDVAGNPSSKSLTVSSKHVKDSKECRSDSCLHLPRRSSELLLQKPKSAPPRSKSIVSIPSGDWSGQPETRSFQWSSWVSPATKSRIKNNLTSLGNLMWGSGPNHSRQGSAASCQEAALSSDMNLPLHVYRYLPVPDEPLMSPYCASPDTLAKMPPVYLLACHLDPLLDDSIEFAKKLDEAGAEVHLDVFDDLPHGFLNFTLISREAKMGCDTCIVRLREILTRSSR